MKIMVHDTLVAHRQILTQPRDKRLESFRHLLIKPLEPMWKALNVPLFPKQPGGYDAIMASRMMAFFDPLEHEAESLEALGRLEKADAWGVAREALERSARTFQQAGYAVPEEVNLVLILADQNNRDVMEFSKGYTGFGGIPEWVVVMLWPNDYTLPRLASAVSHEFNHNVRLQFEPWRNDISLGEYIVMEGLAEMFATELYGERLAGPWVTSMDADELEYSTAVIAKALSTRGFAEIRSYMFGDPLAHANGYQPVGLPYAAGYAVGYQLVKAFLKESGKSILEATFTPSQKIIEDSSFFTTTVYP
jgi:uncharacterized protein YjaZ